MQRWLMYGLLSFSFLLASRTTALGAPVSRYQGPFESRPADPIRRVYYTQLAAKSSQETHGATWIAPLDVPTHPALALPSAQEVWVPGSVVPRKRTRRARKQGPRISAPQ